MIDNNCYVNTNGDKTTAVKHAQLRMKCSLLSGHLYDLHVVHVFNCPLFGAERTELLRNLLTLGITNVNLSLLLIIVTMRNNLI